MLWVWFDISRHGNCHSHREYHHDGSSSDESEDGGGGWSKGRKRENESGFLDEFFEAEFRKRRKVCYHSTTQTLSNVLVFFQKESPKSAEVPGWSRRESSLNWCDSHVPTAGVDCKLKEADNFIHIPNLSLKVYMQCTLLD